MTRLTRLHCLLQCIKMLQLTHTYNCTHIHNDFPYVSDTYLAGEMDVLKETVSVVFQEIAKIKVKLLSEIENNYNI